jgi:hypothetical protein
MIIQKPKCHFTVIGITVIGITVILITAESYYGCRIRNNHLQVWSDGGGRGPAQGRRVQSPATTLSQPAMGPDRPGGDQSEGRGSNGERARDGPDSVAAAGTGNLQYDMEMASLHDYISEVMNILV